MRRMRMKRRRRKKQDEEETWQSSQFRKASKAGQLRSVAIKTSSSLHAIYKKFKLKSMFVSRISPHVSVSVIENFKYGHLKLS